MIEMREDVFALDSAIFVHPKAWVASGHVEGFNDPQVDCKECKSRFRADIILENNNISADKENIEFINKSLKKLLNDNALKCPNCGSSEMTDAREFSLMVETNLGSPIGHLSNKTEQKNISYLRPETCGGIYLQYLNIKNSIRKEIPFGVAQVGKAFRNEIITKQFIFRTREFEQMEMQYFVAPDKIDDEYKAWKKTRWEWYLSNGVPENRIKWHKHAKLAHYASDANDIEYCFECLGGFKEVEGVHSRGNWDLSQHSKCSGVNLDYYDEKKGKKYIPKIVETSAGLNRLVLMFLDLGFNEENIGDTTRTVLKLPWHLAPIKVAILPLLRNKRVLVEKAMQIFNKIKGELSSEYDKVGTIGKRYRRQDEIGTPFCVTIDFDTIEDDTVTIRNRDTMKQERVAIKNLAEHLKERISEEHDSYRKRNP